MLVVASEAELPPTQRVWGTGGWLPPEQREALDWLTLSRLLGWGVTVTRRTGSGLDADLSGGTRWVVIACDPDHLSEESIKQLTSWLAAEPILVVARAGGVDGAFARLAGAARAPKRVGGRSVRWIGPGPMRSWRSRNTLDADVLELAQDTETWATLEGRILIAARQVGRGAVTTLSFHPSQARDVNGIATALLKHLLIWGVSAPVAWFDLEGSLILRMDDPGGAQNVHYRSWSYPKLGEAEWATIGNDLRRRNARLSIGYVAGWVDDGDAERGMLKVADRVPSRVPGRIHPSPLVRYWERASHTPGMLHDYEAEFRGIQALRAAALGEVELHGYAHVHPDSIAWAQAADRYESTSWYRELGKPAAAIIATRPPDEHPLALGIEAFHRYFGAHPTTLICPGDQWTNDVLERALDLGLHLVSSYYLALRDRERFCWAQHVFAPYLDEPDSAWFNAGLPVVGYFHDREPALEGVGWIGRWLDRWQAAGAQSLLDFRELASILNRRLHFRERNGELRLSVISEGAPALVRPLKVAIRGSGRQLPTRLSVLLDDRDLSLRIHPLGHSVGHLILPHSSVLAGREAWKRGG
jgi:hypothetical protein